MDRKILIVFLLLIPLAMTQKCRNVQMQQKAIGKPFMFDQMEWLVELVNFPECEEGARFKWSLHRMISGSDYELTELPGSHIQHFGNGKKITLLFANLSREVLPSIYEKKVGLKVSMYPKDGSWPPAQVRAFSLSASELIIKLKGPPEIEHFLGGDNIVLDASESSDESWPPGIHPMTENKIEWSCTPPLKGNPPAPKPDVIWTVEVSKLEEKKTYLCGIRVTRTRTPFSPASKTAQVKIRVIGHPKLNITCENNCRYDPRKAMEFKVICLDNCYNLDYQWRAVPNPLDVAMQVGPTKSTVTVPEKTLKHDESGTIFVKTGKTEVNTTFKMVEPVAKLEIVCTIGPKMVPCVGEQTSGPDPRDEITLVVTCKKDCEFLNLTWAVKPEIPNLNLQKFITKIDTVALPAIVPKGTYTFSVTSGRSAASLPLTFAERKCSSAKSPFEPDIRKVPMQRVLNRTDKEYELVAQLGYLFRHCQDEVKFMWELSLNKKEFVGGLEKKSTTTKNPLNYMMLRTPFPGVNVYEFPLILKLQVEMPSYLRQATKLEYTYEYWLNPVSLQLTLSGPPVVTHQLGTGPSEIVFNGNSSKDASFVTGEKSILDHNITWSCRPAIPDFEYPKELVLSVDQWVLRKFTRIVCTLTVSRSVPATGSVTYNETKTVQQTVEILQPPPAQIVITCEKNCHNAHAYVDTLIHWECKKYCYDFNATWKVEPPHPNAIALLNDDPHITLPGKTFKAGDKLELTVTMGQGKASLSLDYRKLKPEFVLKCVKESCKYNPRRDVVIDLVCKKECELNDYDWSGSMEFGPLLNKDKMQLIIPRDTLKDGQNVSIIVKAHEGETTFNFTMKSGIPKIKLFCYDPAENKDCNEFPPDVTDVVEIHLVCIKDCEGSEYAWKMTPLPFGFSVEKNLEKGNMKLTIPAKTLEKTEPITLEATADCHDPFVELGKTSLVVNYTKRPPKIEMTCEPEECNQTFNPLLRTEINLTCLKYCEEDNQIKWEMSPLPGDFDWGKSVVLKMHGEKLILLPEAFENGKNITVTAKIGEKSKIVAVLHFVEPPVRIHILCVENCWQANPFKTTFLRAECLQNCDNLTRYNWEFSPKADRMNETLIYGPKNFTITIARDTYFDGNVVKVSLKLRKWIAENTLTYKEILPNLVLKCVTNCNPSNPFESVTLKVDCISDCENVTYAWEPIEAKKKFTFDSSNKTMTIPDKSYEDNERIKVSVTARKKTVQLPIDFKRPPPILKVTCKANCDGEYQNPHKPVKIGVSCQEYCYEPKPKLNYILQPNPVTKGWEGKVKWTGEDTSKDLEIEADVYTHESSTMVLFTTSAGGNSSIPLNFFTPSPDIVLTCNGQVCNTSRPDEDVVVAYNCTTACEKVSNIWDILPSMNSSFWKENITFAPQNKTMTIKKNSFKHGDTISVFLEASEMLVIEGQITFFDPMAKWYGTCEVEPNAGISGVTLFQLLCQDFPEDAFYRVYQTYDGVPGNGSGFLLLYGPIEALNDTFWLSETEGTLTVLVGYAFTEVVRTEKPKVSVSPFAPNDSVPIQLAILRRDKKIKYDIDVENLEELLKNGNFTRALEFGSLLDEASYREGPEYATHYKKHILAVLNNFVEDFDPLKFLTLIVKLSSRTDDLTVYELAVDGALKAAKNLHAMKIRVENYENHFTEIALKYLSDALAKAYECKGKVEIIDGDMTPLKLSREIRKDRVKRLTYGIVTCMEAMGAAYPHTEYEAWGDNIFFKVGQLHPKQRIQGNFSKSYVTVADFMLLESDIEYAFAEFNITPYWWQKLPIPINTYFVTFSMFNVIDDALIRYSVHLQMTEDVPDLEIERSINGSELIELQITPKSLLIAEFITVDEEYHVKIKVDDVDEKFSVNGTKNITKYVKSYIRIEASGESFTLQARFRTVSCWSWHNLSWKDDLCIPSEDQGELGFIKCDCTHLSSYAASAITPKEHKKAKPLSSDSVSPASSFEVLVIPLIILGIFILFCVLLLIAWLVDRKMYEKTTVTVLDDNVPGDAYSYLVSIATGICGKSGTTADVAIKVMGESGTSRIHRIQQNQENPLKSNTDFFFILHTPTYLGELLCIKLWHNSKGKKPHWYCERVIIRDMKSKEVYVFKIENWFSLVYGDGLTYRKIRVFRDVNKPPFRIRFREALRDSHTILSLFYNKGRPGTYWRTVMVDFISCMTVLFCVTLAFTICDCRSVSTILLIAFVSALVTMPVAMLSEFLLKNAD